eukprot:5213699-Karenia_brevis.AAC.1
MMLEIVCARNAAAGFVEPLVDLETSPACAECEVISISSDEEMPELIEILSDDEVEPSDAPT